LQSGVEKLLAWLGTVLTTLDLSSQSGTHGSNVAREWKVPGL